MLPSPLTTQHGNNVFPDGKNYSISEYGEMAKKFREDWIDSHHGGEQVAHDILEKDYWDIVSICYMKLYKYHGFTSVGKKVETGAEAVAVEYANDLDTSRYASGFPVSEPVFCPASCRKAPLWPPRALR